MPYNTKSYQIVNRKAVKALIKVYRPYCCSARFPGNNIGKPSLLVVFLLIVIGVLVIDGLPVFDFIVAQ